MEKISAWMQIHRRHLFIAGPMLLLGLILIFYYINRNSVSTDDAYVKAGNSTISANVSGKVIAIAVHENQWVKQNDSKYSVNPSLY